MEWSQARRAIPFMASASLVSMAGCRLPESQTEPRTPQRMHTKEDTSKNARHAHRPRSVETSTAVCEGVHRESHPQPRRSLRGGSDQCRSYQHPREPGIFANEGATKQCIRQGNREQINSQRARKRGRTIKTSQRCKDDIGVSSAQAPRRAETPIRPIS